MTPRAVIAVARQTRLALVSIQFIPGLTESDGAEGRRLVAEADRLADIFRDQHRLPAAERAWLTGLRLLVAQGSMIENKYKTDAGSGT
jgi:hypothetical protein